LLAYLGLTQKNPLVFFYILMQSKDQGISRNRPDAREFISPHLSPSVTPHCRGFKNWQVKMSFSLKVLGLFLIQKYQHDIGFCFPSDFF
jgi:hypothetical protein